MCELGPNYVHSGTNDLIDGKDLLKKVQKTVKTVNNYFSNTKIVFSRIIMPKDQKKIEQRGL